MNEEDVPAMVPSFPLIPVSFRLTIADPWFLGYFTPTEYNVILTEGKLPSGMGIEDIRVNSFLPEGDEFVGTHILYTPKDKTWRFSYET